MTFQQWANDYCSRFSNFGSVMLQSTSMQADFKDLFDKFPVETLLKATREIALLDPQPFPNEHIPKLLARCKSLSFTPRSHAAVYDASKEPRYRCLDCRDDGVLNVYHPMAYQPIREDCFAAAKHLNSIMVACICDAGDHHSKERTYQHGSYQRVVAGLKRFNPRTMRVIEAARIQEQVTELTEFVLNEYQTAKFSGFEGYQ